MLIALLLTIWAGKTGAIDAQGKFHGSTGNALSFLLTSSLDLQSSLLLSLAIVALIIIPQVLTYIFSGLAGCASAPMFVEGSLTFLVWGFVKSVAVAAGVMAIVPAYSWITGWATWSPDKMLAMSLSALMLLAIAFIVLIGYRGLPLIPEVVIQNLPLGLRQRFQQWHQWMSRKSGT
jgi:hypothetical protein